MTTDDALENLPEGVQSVVLFDTNAYRALAGGGDAQQALTRVERLRAEEERRGIQPLACPTVLMELIAHLGDPADPSYRTAKAALIAAAFHCTMSDGNATYVAIAPSPDLQLCHTLWDRWPDDLLQVDNTIRGLAQAVADDPSEEGLDRIRDDLKLAAETVERAEQIFVEGMRQHLIENLRAELREVAEAATRKEVLSAYRAFLDSDLSRSRVAEVHVRRAMSYLDAVNDSDEEIARKAERVADFFSVTIELYVIVARGIAEDDWDLSKGKGGNYLWDLQVTFLIGSEHTIQGRPMRVVSADKRIIEAAEEARVTELVQPYQKYRGELAAS